MFQDHSWRNLLSQDHSCRNLLSINTTDDTTVLKRLISSCSQAVASCRGLKAVSLLYFRGAAGSSTLTHGVAVQQEEAVRGPPVLHNQIERVGSIKVCLFLCRSRKHQVGMRWKKIKRCGLKSLSIP